MIDIAMVLRINGRLPAASTNWICTVSLASVLLSTLPVTVTPAKAFA